MKTGDKVIGVPLEIEDAEKIDRVVGYLELKPVEFMGEKWETTLVFCETGDGTTVPVECERESLQLAGRREKVTVL